MLEVKVTTDEDPGLVGASVLGVGVTTVEVSELVVVTELDPLPVAPEKIVSPPDVGGLVTSVGVPLVSVEGGT